MYVVIFLIVFQVVSRTFQNLSPEKANKAVFQLSYFADNFVVVHFVTKVNVYYSIGIYIKFCVFDIYESHIVKIWDPYVVNDLKNHEDVTRSKKTCSLLLLLNVFQQNSRVLLKIK
jgi:hypothetical protein